MKEKTRAMDDGGSSDSFPRLPRTELLTVPEVAELLRLTPKGVYALVESRRIPFIRVSNRVRFRRSEIEKWLDGQQVPPVVCTRR